MTQPSWRSYCRYLWSCQKKLQVHANPISLDFSDHQPQIQPQVKCHVLNIRLFHSTNGLSDIIFLPCDPQISPSSDLTILPLPEYLVSGTCSRYYQQSWYSQQNWQLQTRPGPMPGSFDLCASQTRFIHMHSMMVFLYLFQNFSKPYCHVDIFRASTGDANINGPQCIHPTSMVLDRLGL